MTIWSLLRVSARSKYRNRSFNRVKNSCAGGECLILGNGPSLSESLSLLQKKRFFEGRQTICVNDFACSPVYEDIQPRFYVFADPAYWKEQVIESLAKQRERTFSSLVTKTRWDLTLFLPHGVQGSRFLELLRENRNITVCYFNLIPAEGFPSIRHFLYRNNLAMPSPQNVIISGIFLALNLGFRIVYLFGADHSWHENIVIGEDNKLYLKGFARFFEGDVQTTLVPVTHENGDVWKLHDLFQALMITFRSYHELRDYAASIGAVVKNASIKTYIDAFDRYHLDANSSQADRKQERFDTSCDISA